ncbi:glycosyltransferase family 2 protein [Kaistella jeonii]|uniref:glycosyltransferase family 2 protein n=1 Tax=Kaistella jeonii TaxID=266749 RepID=UPI0006912EFE|nr:glycosyltransferase family 2 protein [Kaistella jeonii]SFC19913.1 Glycosyl transferase family 2 [Kaistella jeonii]VEI97011.1 Chondroitin polymerase [Kaistella jeonii]
MKLSIIIPVYNAEKYLHKCLQSVVLQDLEQNFEVILINDGSTDKSLQIAQSFQGQISNYHIFTHKNQGEAISRNIALHMAKGEYVTFLDSDDYYEESCLAKALATIEQDDLDILYLRLKQVDESGNFLQHYADMGLPGKVRCGLRHDRRPFPATVYRKTLIGTTTFPLGIIVGPDSVFNAIVQSKAQRVSFTNKSVYNYTYRTDSLSKQGQSAKAFEGFMRAIREIHTYQQTDCNEIQDAKNYFDKVYEIFVTRIIELNIMPNWSKDNYHQLLTILKELHLIYILDLFASKYPYVNISFLFFKGYQKYQKLKSII